MSAPAAFMDRAASSSDSRPSITHGPPMTTGRPPPIRTPPTLTTVGACGRPSRLASMYGRCFSRTALMPGSPATTTVPATPTTVPPCPSSKVRDWYPAAVAAARMALIVDTGAPAFSVTSIDSSFHRGSAVLGPATAGNKKPRPVPRSPGALFWSTGTLAAHRLPSRQQRRGNVAKKDEAVPAGGSRPVVADGLDWSPDASVHGGTVTGKLISVKALVQ